jgi:cobalt-zinc-cadmium efflux system membrane fusion protein
MLFKTPWPWLLIALLAACKEAPPAAVPEAPSPIVQGGRLRFPPGHPQLALLGTTAAAPGQTLSIELPARLVWNEERTQRIFASFAGRVSRIEADLGQPVKAGSALATLASPDFGAAQADAAKAQVDVDLSRKALARQQELFDAGIAAKKDLEQAQADAGRAAAELARARSRVVMYGGTSSGVDQQLTLRATLPGVVVERNLNPGQELRPDQSGPGVPALFVVSDPTTLWVQIDAREVDVATLRPGAAFELVVPTLPGERFTGQVTAVADAIDPTTRTIKLRGRVGNPQRRLRAEMLGSARFERSLASGVVVPASALTLVGARHLVYMEQSPGVFAPREVTLSFQGPTQAVVTSGLAVGDRVVSENLLLLARQFKLAQEEAPAAQ